MTKQVGFIGVGNMGGPMASNLLKAGYEVKVFDLVPELAARVGADGAIVTSSAAEAAVAVDILISMLPASQHVESLYLGDSGLLASLPKDTLVIDCSTISPEAAKKVNEAAASLGIAMIDAPVSGGVGGAVAGTLTFIVGGRRIGSSSY